MTFIDTADAYGPHSNEELIREALLPYPEQLVIGTKGGFVRSGPEYTDMGAVGNVPDRPDRVDVARFGVLVSSGKQELRCP